MFKNRKGEDINVLYANGSGNLHVNWGIKNCGFGELYLSHDTERNVMTCSSEYMSKESVKAILCKLIDDSFFPDVEEKKKTVVAMSKKEVNEMNLCGIPSDMYLNIPFYTDDDKSNEELFELRWEKNKEIDGVKTPVVINVWLNKAKVIAEITNSEQKYKQEIIDRLSDEGKSEEDIKEVLTAYRLDNPDYLDSLNYSMHKKDMPINETFGDEFVKAEMWTWEITEKKDD